MGSEMCIRDSLYGPADLYYGEEPWKHLARSQGIAGIRNPILSDVAFQAFPWRAAVFAAARERRLPLWNRFLLAGNPLLGAAQRVPLAQKDARPPSALK